MLPPLCLGETFLNCMIIYLFNLFYNGTIHLLLSQNPCVILSKSSTLKAFHM